MADAELAILIKAIDRASADIREIREEVKKLGGAADTAKDKSNELSKAVTKLSLGITAGFVAGVGLAIKSAATFEKALDQVGAVAQATDKEMGALRATALQLGADTAFSANEAAAAMHELAAGGRSVSQIVGGEAAAAVALAAAGNYNLADSAKTIATSMDVWKGTQLETNDVVNRLAGAANQSRFGVEDMSAAIAQGGGVAAAVGVTFQDFTTGITAVASSFASGSDAGTSFKTFMLSLDGSTDKSKEVIKAYGLEFRNATGELKPMAQIVQELHDKIGPLGEAQQVAALKTIFGNDAYRTAAGLMKMTAAEFEAMSAKMGSTNAADVAAQRMGNLSGNIEQLKGSIDTMAITIGTAFIPMLTEAAKHATAGVNAFGQLEGSTQGLIIGFAGLIAVVPAAVAGISKVVGMFKVAEGAAMAMSAKIMIATAIIAAIAISVDQILQKTTGHGLIETMFGNPEKADRTAATLREIDAALIAIGSGDKIGVLTGKLKGINDQFNAIAESKGPQGFMSAKFEARDLEEKVKLLGEAMVANNATTFQLQQTYHSLSPEMRKVFDEATNIVMITEQQTIQNSVAANGLEILAIESARAAAESEKLAGAITPVMRSAKDVADFLGTSWGPALTMAFGTVSGEGIEQLKELALNFPPVGLSAEGLADYLTQNFGPDVAKAFEEVVKSAEENFEKVIDAIGSVLPKMTESFDEWKKNLDKAVEDQVNFKANLKVVWDGIVASGAAMPKEIFAALQAEGPAYIAYFTKLYNEDPAAAMEAFKKIAPAITQETSDAIFNEITNSAPGVSAAVTVGIIDPYNAGMEQAKQDAIALAQATASSVIAELEGDPSLAWTAGSTIGGQFGDGVAAGVAARIQAVKQSVLNLVNGMFGAATGPSGIDSGSPSKRAAEEIGLPFIHGIVVGVEEGAPEVTTKTVDILTTLFGIVAPVASTGMHNVGVASATAFADGSLVKFNTFRGDVRIEMSEIVDAMAESLAEKEPIPLARLAGILDNMAAYINESPLDSKARKKALDTLDAFADGLEAGKGLPTKKFQTFVEGIIKLSTDGLDELQFQTMPKVRDWFTKFADVIQDKKPDTEASLQGHLQGLKKIFDNAPLPDAARTLAANAILAFSQMIDNRGGVAMSDLQKLMSALLTIAQQGAASVASVIGAAGTSPTGSGIATSNSGAGAPPGAPPPPNFPPPPGHHWAWNNGVWQATPGAGPLSGQFGAGPGANSSAAYVNSFDYGGANSPGQTIFDGFGQSFDAQFARVLSAANKISMPNGTYYSITIDGHNYGATGQQYLYNTLRNAFPNGDIPGYKSGVLSVPRDTLAFLHAGEEVRRQGGNDKEVGLQRPVEVTVINYGEIKAKDDVEAERSLGNVGYGLGLALASRGVL